jgi:acetyl-CoA carboxylase carboxyl transferase subunit beta
MDDKIIFCKKCNASLTPQQLKENFYTCSKCNYHFRIDPQTRIKLTFDSNSFKKLLSPTKEAQLASKALELSSFTGYKETYSRAVSRTTQHNAVIAGSASIGKIKLYTAIMDFNFIGGSFGRTEGLIIAAIMKKAIKHRRPLIIFTASGGARMQDGISALTKMNYTSALALKMKQKRVPLFTVLTDPTSGGVTASIATAANIIIAEPGAFTGFAGPSVTGRTISINATDQQNAEHYLAAGQIDMIVHRKNIPGILKNLLHTYTLSNSYFRKKFIRLLTYSTLSKQNNSDYLTLQNLQQKTSISTILNEAEQPSGQVSDTAFNRIKFIRSTEHISTCRIIDKIFDYTLELCGDRISEEDRTVYTGIGFHKNLPFFFTYFRRGRNYDENLEYRFSMASSSGYRKIKRILHQAEAAGIPFISFIDTPGAYPGPEAERTGIAAAISETAASIATASIPVLTVVTGQGGSGGATAATSAQRIVMTEFSFFSVISPEGCCAVLKDRISGEQASDALQLLPEQLLKRGFADRIIYSGAPDLNQYSRTGATAYAEQLSTELLRLYRFPLSNSLKKFKL